MLKLTSGASVGALAIALATPALAQDTGEEGAQERTGGVGTILVASLQQTPGLHAVPANSPPPSFGYFGRADPDQGCISCCIRSYSQPWPGWLHCSRPN